MLHMDELITRNNPFYPTSRRFGILTDPAVQNIIPSVFSPAFPDHDLIPFNTMNKNTFIDFGTGSMDNPAAATAVSLPALKAVSKHISWIPEQPTRRGKPIAVNSHVIPHTVSHKNI